MRSLDNKTLLLLADELPAGATDGVISNELAVAGECVARGAAVLIGAKELTTAEALAGDVRKAGGRAEACVCDVTSEQSCRRAAARAVETFGSLSLLVNLVGIVDQSNVIDLSDADFTTGLSVNVLGHFHAIKAAIPEMEKAGGGAIVVVSSLSALRCGGAGIGYEVGKAALLALTRNVAVSAAASNVRVNSILPGVLDSAAFRSVAGEIGVMFREKIPLKRLGTPQEFAKAVVFLLSDEAAYITGTTLLMDGGMSIPI